MYDYKIIKVDRKMIGKKCTNKMLENFRELIEDNCTFEESCNEAGPSL